MDTMNDETEPKLNRILLTRVLIVAVALCLLGIVIFFSYFRVNTVEVNGNTRHTEDEIKELALNGFFANNSVLAPMLYTKTVQDVSFVEKFVVTRVDRHKLLLSVHEKKPVGCFRYLDNYIYFDRNGVFLEGSRTLESKTPFFHGIEADAMVEGKKLPIKGSDVLSTAVSLSAIFEKNDTEPDYIEFGDNNQILIVYGDITVNLGKNQFLEDKMARALAILPKLEGKKGILHLESVNDTTKTVTFEQDQDQYALSKWTGGYNEEGDFTGSGEYDAEGNYVGPKPGGEEETTESSDADAENAETENSEETSSEDSDELTNVSTSDDSYDESYDDGSYDDSYDDGSYDYDYDESYDDGSYDYDYDDGSYDYDYSYDESYDY